ncbi:PLDc N-terminal domain-containing protein [Streptomyces sp. FH025]|uniref:PLDc N-terminal domain-containing protein n=1 Tax=Streptomyces sp. FH025 TaxID=2815937 RepID=UPI001A9DD425|nr:PLDc N-terminal domain-containing protein [Streptomyces sp. FH025]MBO1415290.1 PLDc N-terminal domain-containing protein [Streptomyces sp. FH025]
MLAEPLGSLPSSPWIAIVPLIAVLPAVLCMLDISRHPHTRLLPPQVWLAVCVCGNIVGLFAYLRFGRSQDR